MAHNGITSLNDYDLTVMHEWEIEKVKKAIEKRKRRDKREEEERKANANKKKKREQALSELQNEGQKYEH